VVNAIILPPLILTPLLDSDVLGGALYMIIRISLESSNAIKMVQQ
jgi:hypothetical protein